MIDTLAKAKIKGFSFYGEIGDKSGIYQFMERGTSPAKMLIVRNQNGHLSFWVGRLLAIEKEYINVVDFDMDRIDKSIDAYHVVDLKDFIRGHDFAKNFDQYKKHSVS